MAVEFRSDVNLFGKLQTKPALPNNDKCAKLVIISSTHPSRRNKNLVSNTTSHTHPCQGRTHCRTRSNSSEIVEKELAFGVAPARVEELSVFCKWHISDSSQIA